ncbi:rhamnosyl/mannosyltransferase [Methanofollis sp. W23]|uniref:glycosyltransferase family 4 protein n=1 Tax=Methanofollis sp. W23 TaxID=2817849 RepID=UPI001AE69B25|nr:glycosyltransferase family 4 protein [Methanofollis sp. W23]MBP2144596.1 rhamnosyl/mannosyltransferase [Methanofollis sp. W23]
MKILQCVPYYLPYHGGQESYVHNLSKSLIQRGHEVDVITSDYPAVRGMDEIDGVQIFRHRCLARPLRNPLTPGFFHLTREYKDYDLVHTHNEHSTAAIATSLGRMFNDLPVLLTCHGRLIFGDHIRDRLERLYSLTIGWSIFARADGIVVNSVDDRAYVLSIHPHAMDKMFVVHNAVDPRQLDAVPEEPPAGMPSSGFILLYVGRLIRRKGLEWLIRAMATIKKTDPTTDLRCILVGEGEDQDYFTELIRELGVSDSVFLMGAVTQAELVYLYRHADLFVLPSLSEVCPTVVLEAMYFGLPVITTDIPGVRDHFSCCASLVPPRDEQALAEAILTVSGDHALSQRLSRIGQNLVRTKYTWETVSKNYESIYQKVVNGK